MRIELLPDEEYDDLTEEIQVVDNHCPKCGLENSLVVMYRKDKFIKDKKSHTTMKISCIKCEWKITGNYKI